MSKIKIVLALAAVFVILVMPAYAAGDAVTGSDGGGSFTVQA